MELLVLAFRKHLLVAIVQKFDVAFQYCRGHSREISKMEVQLGSAHFRDENLKPVSSARRKSLPCGKRMYDRVWEARQHTNYPCVVEAWRSCLLHDILVRRLQSDTMILRRRSAGVVTGM